MITRRAVIKSGLALPLVTQPLLAQAVFQHDGVALRGYDPVAYFTNGAATKGEADFTAHWDNAAWHFASAANRAQFLNSPEAFAPQYGGYCAWAVSQGYTAPIDPDASRIVDGKLYLNANRRIQRRWEQDVAGHIAPRRRQLAKPPRGVVTGALPLQRTHRQFTLTCGFHGQGCRMAACKRGVIGDLVIERDCAHRAAVFHRLRAFGRVQDQINHPVLHHIDNRAPTFIGLVDHIR